MHGSDFMEISTARMRASEITGGKILVQDHLVKFWLGSRLSRQEKLSIYDYAWDGERSF